MDFDAYRKRFHACSEPFRQADGSFPFAIRIKIGHTSDVCRITRELGTGFPEHEREIFLLTALFHDVSRFEQYAKFKTFRDDKSFDHGTRSAEIIGEQNLLEGIPAEDVSVITDAIRTHNKLMLPEPSSDAAKMIRDADKLAILELLIAFFNGPEDVRRQEAAKLDLPDTDGWTPQILTEVLAGRPVRHADLRCVNDFKLILFAWARDLNFPQSAHYALEKGLYPAIRKLLPESAEIDRLLKQTSDFLSTKGQAS